MSTEQVVRTVVMRVKEELQRVATAEGEPLLTVPVGVSNRHVHLSGADLEILFGPGYSLHPVKELSQIGQYGAEEVVTLAGPRGVIEKVRVLGPLRKQTQVEISRSDSYLLGIKPPIKDSGDLQGSTGLVLIGPRGCIQLQEGVICAARHIHFHTTDAKKWGIKEGDQLSVKVGGERSLVFHNVLARVSDKYKLELHIDTDEANAANVQNGDKAEVLLQQKRSDCCGSE